MRLLVLTAGVTMGVLSEELVADAALSLLRERLDEEGDMGLPVCCAISESVLRNAPLSLALRLRARSLCSLKKLVLGVGVGVGVGLEGEVV